MAHVCEFAVLSAKLKSGAKVWPSPLYGKDWTMVEESFGIDEAMAEEWVKFQTRAEKGAYEYCWTDGRAFTEAEYAAWLALEDKAGRQLSAVEFIATL